MNKTGRRLLMAALLSLTGFASTFALDRFFATKDTGTKNAKEIARLVNSVNEVQKKQIQKLIWEPTVDNEVLHVGEAIRTSANSEARIEFINSKTAIDLEPDSAIVLEEADGKLSLDFVKGNIFVKSDAAPGANGQAITLKSGTGNIDLGKSEVSLGKSKNGALDLQVLEGSVKGAEPTANTIKVLRPLPNEPVYLNTALNEAATFQWLPLAAGYKVFLEAGVSRQDLKPIDGSETDAVKGEFAAKIKVGKTFFRLVARSQDPKQPELTSPVLRLMILAKTPPVLLSPEKETAVTLNKNEAALKFLWSNPAGFAKVIIEIASSSDLTQNRNIEYLENVSEYTFDVKKSGVYFWRVSGVLEGRKDVVSSNVQKFKINLLDELMPPTLESPRDAEKVPVELLKDKGLSLSWQPVMGAARYHVVVQNANEVVNVRTPAATNENIFEDEGHFLQVNVPTLKPGVYSWSVTSIGNKNETSKPSEKRTFTVQTLPVLNWADGKLKGEIFYLSLKPSLPLQWDKGDSKTATWNVHVYSSSPDISPITLSATQNSIEADLPKDGVYTADVEAVDSHGVVLARTAKREIKVTAAPLLPAPVFAKTLPEQILANGSGSATVEWQEVQGASKYVISVKSADGKETKEYSFDSLAGQVRGLMPGEYKVALKTVDTHGRPGPEGEERPLKVPNQSDVKAPKFKGIKVK
jgi:hypothetical protein